MSNPVPPDRAAMPGNVPPLCIPLPTADELKALGRAPMLNRFARRRIKFFTETIRRWREDSFPN